MGVEREVCEQGNVCREGKIMEKEAGVRTGE